MTCIAAVEHEGVIWMGGDSAGVSGYDLDVRADEKVFRNGELLMGFTSSFRMGQILRYAFEPPEHFPSKDDLQYLVVDFIDAVRAVFNEKGYLRIPDNEGAEEGGTFLLAYRGKLYTVEDDFQIARSRAEYTSVGCGAAYALGSLHATSGSQIHPSDRVRMALEAASRFSAGVRGPYVILSSSEESDLT